MGIITCLCNRAEEIFREDKVENERNSLQEGFEASRYPPISEASVSGYQRPSHMSIFQDLSCTEKAPDESQISSR